MAAVFRVCGRPESRFRRDGGASGSPDEQLPVQAVRDVITPAVYVTIVYLRDVIHLPVYVTTACLLTRSFYLSKPLVT